MTNTTKSQSAYEALRQKVDRIVKGDAVDLPEEAQIDLLGLAHELEVAHVELETQNEQLRKTSRKLESSRREYWDLYESAPVAYVTLSPKGLIQKVNAAAREILNRAGPDPVGHAFSTFVVTEDMGRYFRSMKKIAAEHSTGTFDLRMADKKLRPVRVHIQAAPKFDGAGNFSHWHLAFFDISEQKQFEEDLRISRENLDLATRAGAIGLWRSDLRTHQSYWNEQLYRMLGLTPRNGPEKVERFFEFIHPEDSHGGLENPQRLLELGDEIDLEFRIVRADDGQIRWLAARGTIDRDAAGRAVRMQGVNWDITDRKQSELELQQNRERFRAVLEHSLDIAFRRNLQTQTYDYISPVIEQITGFGPDEISTLSSEDLMALVHPEDRIRVTAEVEQACKSGQGKLEFRFQRKNGGYCWMGDFFTIQKDADGRPLYRIGVMRDITEQKETEKKLTEQQKQLAEKLLELQQSNAELSEYAYVVSHDLKAPLRAVRNYADFLIEDLQRKLTGEQETYLEGLKKAVSQGDALIRDLLNFARIGQTRETPEEINLERLVDEVCETLQMDDETRVSVRSGCPSLTADPLLLKMILVNLVANGLKFNHSDVKRVEVACRAVPGGRVELRVTDNGIGIEDRYRDQIFRVFQRLHSDTAYEGTGIGLAIVRKAAIQMGGSVRLESTPGDGSTFIVNLPERPVK
jgi:PAS domain S-box-containing protein